MEIPGAQLRNEAANPSEFGSPHRQEVLTFDEVDPVDFFLSFPQAIC